MWLCAVCSCVRRVVLSTLFVYGENAEAKPSPTSTNLDLYSSVVEKVAADLHVPLAPTRQRAREYLRAVNVYPEGSSGIFEGIVTADGLHPCGQTSDDPHRVVRCAIDSFGNLLIADAIAEALLAGRE